LQDVRHPGRLEGFAHCRDAQGSAEDEGGYRCQGKAGWSASGFPTEGTQANAATIGGAAGRADLRPGEEGRDRQGARARSWLGQLSGPGQGAGRAWPLAKELVADPEATAEEAMRNGSATFRPDEPVEKMAKPMRER
jgi:hypothetical protein